MDLNKIISGLDDTERVQYIKLTASGYFRYLYYSKPFMPILEKLDGNNRLDKQEWDYLIKRLFLVTCKAISEEDSVNFKDKIIYILSKIGVNISIIDSHLYNECYKMVSFIDSIDKEKDINRDLLKGIELTDNSKSMTDLDILLKQHREACIFRDNQDSFYDAYNNSYSGFITESERGYINSMNRSYDREKNLVNEYKNVI